MTEAFPFNKSFQASLLGMMCQKSDFILTAIELIKPEYFEDLILSWYFQTIRKYFINYKKLPTEIVLKNEINQAHRNSRIKDEELKQYLDTCKTLFQPVEEKEYVTKEVVQFCRRQEVKKVTLEIANNLNATDPNMWDEIVGKMQKACDTGVHSLDIGTQYFLDYPERLRRRTMGEDRIVIPTGITELDMYLSGGVKSGQLMLFMASTGVGKSLALVHCGKRAVVQKFKVVHYTVELDESGICERYDSSWSSIPVIELNDRSSELSGKLSKLSGKYGNSLLVKFYPQQSASVNTIRNHLNQMRLYGFIPDLLIVDYVDELRPTVSHNDLYADQGMICSELRGLAGELHIPVISATQGNRAGKMADVLDIEHIADSIKKANVADILVAICATAEERNNNSARLFIPKNRNGPAGVEIPIRTNYERMCFFDPTAPVAPLVGKIDKAVGRKSDYK